MSIWENGERYLEQIYLNLIADTWLAHRQKVHKSLYNNEIKAWPQRHEKRGNRINIFEAV